MFTVWYQACENWLRFSNECAALLKISLEIVIEPLVRALTVGCRGVAFFTRNHVEAYPRLKMS